MLTPLVGLLVLFATVFFCGLHLGKRHVATSEVESRHRDSVTTTKSEKAPPVLDAAILLENDRPVVLVTAGTASSTTEKFLAQKGFSSTANEALAWSSNEGSDSAGSPVYT